jgi:dihydroorotate dehydrogenase
MSLGGAMEDNYLRKRLGDEDYTEAIAIAEEFYKNESVEDIGQRIEDITRAIDQLIIDKARALEDITEYAQGFAGINEYPNGLSIDIWTDNVRKMRELEKQKSIMQLERKVLRKMRQDKSDCNCAIHCPTEEVTL